MPRVARAGASHLAALPALLAALLLAGAAASEAKTTPIGKVNELLQKLKDDLVEDEKKDGNQFKGYTDWYDDQKTKAIKIIKDTKEQVDGLNSELKRQEGIRDSKSSELEKFANKVVRGDEDLKTVREERGAEHKTYTENEASLVEAIDQLERSLAVMGKKAPEDGAASLLTTAKQLRMMLLQGDVGLTKSQRETVDSFVRLARQRSLRARRQASGQDAPEAEEPAPSFLQAAAAAGGPHGEYESQGSTVTDTLQAVLDKAEKNLKDLRDEEQKKLKSFKKLEEELEGQIKGHQKSVSDLKTQISQSQETSGQMKAERLSAEGIVKVTEEELEKLEEDFVIKNASYHEREKYRADEILALTEAIQIMGDKEMEQYTEEKTTAPEFLQLAQASRRKKIEFARTIRDSGLALLSLRTHARHRRAAVRARVRTRVQRDPMAKVKDLIRDLIQNLMQKLNEETKLFAWCEKEEGENEKAVSRRKDDVERKEAFGAEIDAQVAELTDDLKRIAQDLADMREAVSTATSLRESEGAAASTSISKYKEAQRIIQSGLDVLKKFYSEEKKSGNGGPALIAAVATPDNGAKQRAGLASGVIGILEISLGDFAKLEEEATLAESASQRDYKDIMNQMEVKIAVFNKDLEYKRREKVKLEGDRVRINKELKVLNQELDALARYLEQVKVQCGKPPTFEERQQRRQELIESLKNALEQLE